MPTTKCLFFITNKITWLQQSYKVLNRMHLLGNESFPQNCTEISFSFRNEWGTMFVRTAYSAFQQYL